MEINYNQASELCQKIIKQFIDNKITCIYPHIIRKQGNEKIIFLSSCSSLQIESEHNLVIEINPIEIHVKWKFLNEEWALEYLSIDDDTVVEQIFHLVNAIINRKKATYCLRYNEQYVYGIIKRNDIVTMKESLIKLVDSDEFIKDAKVYDVHYQIAVFNQETNFEGEL